MKNQNQNKEVLKQSGLASSKQTECQKNSQPYLKEDNKT